MSTSPQETEWVDRIRRLIQPLKPIPTGQAPRLHPLPGIRAVLFDIYGTLFISGSGEVGSAEAIDNVRALDQALHASGCGSVREDTAAEGIRRFFAAVRSDHQRRRQQGCLCPEIEVREIWGEVLTSLAGDHGLTLPPGDPVSALAVEYEARANPVAAMPGFPEILSPLTQAGLPLGIVSNAQFYTPLTFQALTGRSPEALGFEPELCAWSYRMRIAKPDPALFEPVLQALHRTGIQPADAVYVGNDMLNDVYTASICGLRTILFAGDRRSLRLRPDDPRCRSVEPDAVVTELAQVPGLLLP